MTPHVEPCRKFSLEGPLQINGVDASVWLHDVRLDTEIISQHSRATYETAGGDCRQCGLVRVTVEFFES